MRNVLIATIAISSLGLACFTCAEAKEKPPTPKPKPIELSGTLQKYGRPGQRRLHISPTGHTKWIILKGSLLDDIELDTPIHVKGVVRSQLHKGGTNDDPSPLPPSGLSGSKLRM